MDIKKIIIEELELTDPAFTEDIVYEDDNLIVIYPKTREASCKHGEDTNWCTATDGGQSFHEYNDKGNLYYHIWKFKMPNNKQNYQKIARFIDYGKEYGEEGDFFLFDDEQVDNSEILFNVLNGKKLKEGGFEYPAELKPLNESWEKAFIAVDTHYAKNGLHKEPSYSEPDIEDLWDDDYEDWLE